MKYLVVVEKAENNYSAYVPDLRGALLPVERGTKYTNRYAPRLRSTWKVFAKMAFLSLSHKLKLNAWRPESKPLPDLAHRQLPLEQ